MSWNLPPTDNSQSHKLFHRSSLIQNTTKSRAKDGWKGRNREQEIVQQLIGTKISEILDNFCHQLLPTFPFSKQTAQHDVPKFSWRKHTSGKRRIAFNNAFTSNHAIASSWWKRGDRERSVGDWRYGKTGRQRNEAEEEDLKGFLCSGWFSFLRSSRVLSR